MTPRPRPVAEGFEPYVWASTAEEVAARRGLEPAQVIRYDANVPPLPGVPQVPLGESFARLNEYPEGGYRGLREAAAAYAGVDADWIVPDAGADGVMAPPVRAGEDGSRHSSLSAHDPNIGTAEMGSKPSNDSIE